MNKKVISEDFLSGVSNYICNKFISNITGTTLYLSVMIEKISSCLSETETAIPAELCEKLSEMADQDPDPGNRLF